MPANVYSKGCIVRLLLLSTFGTLLLVLTGGFSGGGAILDPNREMSGVGFLQRRSSAMNPENPGALEWLKVMQDHSSRRGDLLCSMEGDDEAQTFNNSLVAIAFMVKGERTRAERILDFYAGATVDTNSDPALQNFFYRCEQRGFYQHVSLRTRRDDSRSADRWIGDMAWLLLAYKQYESRFHSDRYNRIAGLLKNLLLSYYVPEGDGGYIRHGWRRGDDHLHEQGGHHEGNIDCFAVLRLCGEDGIAEKIRVWLGEQLTGREDFPLDLYTWRVLAFGRGSADLLNIPEYDLRYRKTMVVHGRKVAGFYHGPDAEQQNIWVDGTGHMACAFFASGNVARGYFYANQLDNLLIEKELFGHRTASLPYTVNRTGGYGWVDTTKGFSSCVAWYVLAKNSCNPFVLPAE